MSPRVINNPLSTTTTLLRRSGRTRCPRIIFSPESQPIIRSVRLAKKALEHKQASWSQSDSLLPHTHSDEPSAATATSEIIALVTTSDPQEFSFVHDLASRSASSLCCSDSEAETKAKDEENKHLSSEHLRFGAADVMHNHKERDDSQRETENETYEVNGFVIVSDDDEDNEETDQAVVYAMARRDSVYSTSSEDTLFVSETKRKKKKSQQLVSQDIPFMDLSSPEDVTEYVTNAIARFSRRCNRHRAPVVFGITKEVWMVTEMRDALDRAVKLGLAMGAEMSDGSVMWCIGPRVAKDLV
jgi:hypothetical protein